MFCTLCPRGHLCPDHIRSPVLCAHTRSPVPCAHSPVPVMSTLAHLCSVSTPSPVSTHPHLCLVHTCTCACAHTHSPVLVPSPCWGTFSHYDPHSSDQDTLAPETCPRTKGPSVPPPPLPEEWVGDLPGGLVVPHLSLLSPHGGRNLGQSQKRPSVVPGAHPGVWVGLWVPVGVRGGIGVTPGLVLLYDHLSPPENLPFPPGRRPGPVSSPDRVPGVWDSP